LSEPRITKQQYEQTEEAKSLPYINALEEHNLPYTPDPGTERTRSDDQAILFDTSMEQFRNSNIQTRIHMDKKSFDDYFHRMLDYYETTESIFFDRCQNGEVTKKDFVIRLKRDLERMYPEVCRYKTDQEMMIQRLYVAVFGYYVLQPLIDNPQTTDIKVCGPKDIRVRIKGKAYSSSEGFAGVRDLTMFVKGICIRNKIRYGKQPVVTFADSHDKNYILRFVISDPMVNAVPYPYLHIRKIPKTKPMFADLCTAEHNHMLTPQIADYLINRAKNARGVVFAGPPGCVDYETEFFNGKEWKSISEYKDGEQVLQFDTETGIASLVKPLRYIKAPCDLMYHFETKYGIDQTLSPEHRVLYLNRTHKNGEKIWGNVFHEMSAAELYKQQNSGKFYGGFLTTFAFEGNGIDLNDAELKLMLAVICDGTFNKDRKGNACMVNLKKERKINELRSILRDCQIAFSEHKKKNGFTVFYFHAPRREKKFGSDWYQCTSHQLQLICDNVLQWDGHVSSENRRTFSTTVKETADFVQFAFSACGYRTTIEESNRSGQKYTTCGKEYTRKNDCYTLVISDNRVVGMAAHNDGRTNNTKLIPTRPKDGMKYCFTVPTHAFVLRRHGKIFVSGNSGKTTALNAFIEHIPKTRESLVIQENDELFTNQPGFMFKHVTHGYDGNRPYTLQDLGQMALVEGCNEFIIGEVKGGEMRNVMTLLNAGGYAALTVHSTNAYETMDKLADLVKYGSDYSFEEAHRMLSAMDTVIYMEGYKVRTILEIHGYNDQTHSYNYELVYKYDYDEEQRFLKMQEQARARNEPDPTDPFHSIMM
jgi:Flp pilus assembly CpaF family ATPase